MEPLGYYVSVVWVIFSAADFYLNSLNFSLLLVVPGANLLLSQYSGLILTVNETSLVKKLWFPKDVYVHLAEKINGLKPHLTTASSREMLKTIGLLAPFSESNIELKEGLSLCTNDVQQKKVIEAFKTFEVAKKGGFFQERLFYSKPHFSPYVFLLLDNFLSQTSTNKAIGDLGLKYPSLFERLTADSKNNLQQLLLENSVHVFRNYPLNLQGSLFFSAYADQPVFDKMLGVDFEKNFRLLSIQNYVLSQQDLSGFFVGPRTDSDLVVEGPKGSGSVAYEVKVSRQPKSSLNLTQLATHCYGEKINKGIFVQCYLSPLPEDYNYFKIVEESVDEANLFSITQYKKSFVANVVPPLIIGERN